MTTQAAQRAGVEVRLENLRRTYGTVTALDGLDLTLHPGELVALLGPSGCGKTTALRLVAQYDPRFAPPRPTAASASYFTNDFARRAKQRFQV